MKRLLLTCIALLNLGFTPSQAAGLLRPADGTLPEPLGNAEGVAGPAHEVDGDAIISHGAV